MKVAYLTNAEFTTGVGYYAVSLAQELKKSHFALIPIHLTAETISVNEEQFARLPAWPGFLGSKSVGWIRLRHRLAAAVRHMAPELVHATNQTLSFVRTKLPLIVTVHDLIEVLEPQDPRSYLINRYLLRGIASADHIIAVSAYTKQKVLEHYPIPPERITVIPNGVGPEFYPIHHFRDTIGYQALCQTLHLSPNARIVLYVGSEHPRKNVPTALRAFARLLETYPQAVFLKVGEAATRAGRAVTLRTIDRLGIREQVRLLGNVSYDDLNSLYNLADVLIFPSRFEGFGLPVLQAFAAGAPVVAANATSLPEVAGEAAVLSDPDNVDGFAGALYNVMTDTTLVARLRDAGLRRAQQFSWQRAAEATALVYKKVLAS